jgi:hypothetical protein
MTIRQRLRLRSRARNLQMRWTNRDRALPDFLILGTQKGGTASLYAYLTSLPQVIGVERKWKEVHYFASYPNPNNYRVLGPGWYRSHFPRRSELHAAGAITGEATPNYMIESLAMTRIAHDLPESRWVVVLRDPVERARSHHEMLTRYQLEDRHFADAVTRELELIELGRTIPGTTNVIGNDRDFIGGGRYSEQLRVLSNLRPDRPTLVLFSEHLFEAHAESLALLHQFLGLPEPVETTFPVANTGNPKEELDPHLRFQLETFFDRANAELPMQLRSDQFITVDPTEWPEWVPHEMH